jgi:tetratricopeptide (TPR) repeat protein
VDVPEQRQPRKRPDGNRPDSRGGAGQARRGGPGAGGQGRAGSDDKRKAGPRRDDKRPDKRSDRPYSRGRDDDRRRDDVDRSESQRAYDGPPIPEHVTGRELDRSVQAQLQSLPDKLALRVARHLVAAGELLDTEPKTAYQHTLAARGRAGRLAIVREAVGEAAYAAGEYAEALAELRAARRMNGSQDYVAMMADCERALGRSDRALTLIKNAPRDKLSTDVQAELTIVEAGARRDRGELDAALRTLENAPLLSKSREPWVARLRYAYADTLVAAGRHQDALAWFHRTEAVDVDEQTDAGERAAQIERENPTGA